MLVEQTFHGFGSRHTGQQPEGVPEFLLVFAFGEGKLARVEVVQEADHIGFVDKFSILFCAEKHV